MKEAIEALQKAYSLVTKVWAESPDTDTSDAVDFIAQALRSLGAEPNFSDFGEDK